ncbi:cytochrome P450 4d8-like isoform X2 [Episyrphus balteatus]|uniref:cytochrome P450 4d8-like isoform X2 n=1 Tax=Episyrphus balteatus TaxID=286459 RepID=UPI002485B482|nr:cytochrome P450 4d8-like isoform X2 [Episyrphus balteatus]
MVLWLCIFAFLIVLTIAQYFLNKHKNQLVANLNGPYPFVLVGSVHKLFCLSPQNFFKQIIHFRKIWGKVYRIWIFNRLIIAIGDPKVAEVLLSSQTHIKKHHLYNLLRPWLGTGLLMSDGRKWFARRKIITPTFHFQILERFVEVFDQQSDVLVKQLEKHCQTGKEFDVHPYIGLAALDIITETAMGTKINAQSDPTNEYTRAVNDITQIMSLRFLNVPIANDTIFSIVCPKIKRRQIECIKTMHSFTIKVIEEHRKALKDELQNQENGNHISNEGVESKERMALLDVLLQSTCEGKPLTNEDIREEVDTFMFEGHDTTTSAISFALSQIARHSNVQEKLYEEICEILDKEEDNCISYRVLQELKYTEGVIKETLRLYPPVPVIARELLQDMSYDGGVLPAGSEILLGIWLMGHDADLFPDPEEFRPERHLLESSDRASSFSFIPFSAGPRNCIGQKFAMLEMKCVIMKIVQKFKLLPLGEDVKPRMNLVLRSDNGFQMGLEHRKS